MSTTRIPRALQLAAVTSLAVVTLALSAFAPSRKAALSPRFNHVMLYVANLDSSIAFYTTAFDLQVAQRINALGVNDATPRPVKMALLKFPGQEFVLELAERPVTAGASPYYQHLGIDVRDIASAAERVKKAGGTEMSAIQTVKAGSTVAKNAFFRGPSGERVELMEVVSGEF
jgi:catechol 2,3-dioxygenase-like lactoylglutathione lyase family enzyme